MESSITQFFFLIVVVGGSSVTQIVGALTTRQFEG